MSLPFFPQETRFSCTVACLRMLLTSCGVFENEDVLRACCRTTFQGTAANHVVTCAQSYGLTAYEQRGVQWQELETFVNSGIYPVLLINLFPLKALWVRHAVVLETIEVETVQYLDPIDGRQSANHVSFEQAWQMNHRRAIVIQC